MIEYSWGENSRSLHDRTALQASQTVALAQIQQRLVALPHRLAESDAMREQHRDILKIVQEFQNITDEVKQLRGRFDQVNFGTRLIPNAPSNPHAKYGQMAE